MAAQRRSLASAAWLAAARASFMCVGRTLIFTIVVAGEDARAMGMNSHLRVQAGGRFSARMVNPVAPDSWAMRCKSFAMRSSAASLPA